MNFYENVSSLKFELLKKGLGVFFIRIAGAGATFGMYLYLGRLLGAAGFGLFSLALTVVTILAVFNRLGLDTLAMRLVSSRPSSEGNRCARSVVSPVLRITFFVSLVTMLSVSLFAGAISSKVFAKPELESVLRNMMPALVFFVVGFILAEALKGVQKSSAAILVQYVSYPLLFLMFLVFFDWYEYEMESGMASLLFSISTLVVLVLTVFYWYRVAAPGRCKSVESVSGLLRQGGGLLLIAAGGMLLSWTDIVVLGVFEKEENVGLYMAASRTAMLTSLALVSVNAIVAPLFSNMYASGDWVGLKRVANYSSWVLSLTVLAPVASMLTAPAWIMSFFGEEFSSGGGILSILAIGQLINVVCGSVGYLLVMTRNEIVYQRILLYTAGVNLALSLILVQIIGVYGVAIATSVSMAGWNIWSLIEVKRKLGFWMLI